MHRSAFLNKVGVYHEVKYYSITICFTGDKDDEDNGLVIIVGVASGGAVLIGLLVIITVATFIVRKRTMRPIGEP